MAHAIIAARSCVEELEFEIRASQKKAQQTSGWQLERTCQG